MQKIFIANWKENPETIKQAKDLFLATKKAARYASRVTTVACPPFIYLEGLVLLQKKNPSTPSLKRGRMYLGTQDISYEEHGAHTGEVGPKMLRRMGVSYTIVGHSERRAMGESDTMINKKIRAAGTDKLRVILCVGEPLELRKKGKTTARRFITSQLKKALKGVSAMQLIIAYEPIWAIGTGESDSVSDAQEMATFIKKEVAKIFNLPPTTHRLSILYGGSVNSENIADYVKYKEIDGVLVGGASLKTDEIKKMIQIAHHVAGAKKK